MKVDPGFAPARLNLGRRLFARQAYEEAREEFFRLTQIAPTEMVGFVGLAECLLRLSRDGEADEAIVRARALFGDRPELLMLVARQLMRRGAYRRAEEVLTPLTSDRDASRAGAAWAWIAVCRLAEDRRESAAAAANESLAFDRRKCRRRVRAPEGDRRYWTDRARDEKGATHLGSSVPEPDRIFAPDPTSDLSPAD